MRASYPDYCFDVDGNPVWKTLISSPPCLWNQPSSLAWFLLNILLIWSVYKCLIISLMINNEINCNNSDGVVMIRVAIMRVESPLYRWMRKEVECSPHIPIHFKNASFWKRGGGSIVPNLRVELCLFLVGWNLTFSCMTFNHLLFIFEATHQVNLIDEKYAT